MAIFPTYNRYNLIVDETSGTTITDVHGKKYLDFGSGIGVCNLGHLHPKVLQAVEIQLQKSWHVSNLYEIPLQQDVAELITQNSVADYVFFCNSGAEANEAAIKLARSVTSKDKIITFQQSFHGRTFATMTATGQEKVHQGFGPLLPTFDYAAFNDIDSVTKLIDNNTAAIMLEVVQGEGGIHPATPAFMKDLQELCQAHELLLIVDEIQTGIGRTGKKFAYEHYDISPDIITLAKALGNGIPIGVMAAKENYRDFFGPGSHGSTFGGNPLAMAAAKTVLTEVFSELFLFDVQQTANYLKEQLEKQIKPLQAVKDIRQLGLMIGIECHKPVNDYIEQLLNLGLVVLSAGDQVLRLLPPLIITKDEIDQAIHLLNKVLQ